MGRKKQKIGQLEGNMAFIFLYRTYLYFIDVDEDCSAFDPEIHTWIKKEYKIFRRKRASAIKGLELNNEFSKAYPYIERNAFHIDDISQLNWTLEKKLNDRDEYKNHSGVLANMINDKMSGGSIATDVWNYVTPLMRRYREFELDDRIRENIALLKNKNLQLHKKKEVIDKALEFIATRKGAMKKFNKWLERNN